MAHRSARLTPITRLELVREVVAGWPQAEVARRFRVSRPMVQRWSDATAGMVRRAWKTVAPPRTATPSHLAEAGCGASAPCAVARASAPIASPGRSTSPAPPSMQCSAVPASTVSIACTASPGTPSATNTRPRGSAAHRRERARSYPRRWRQALRPQVRRDALRTALAALARAGVPARRRRAAAGAAALALPLQSPPTTRRHRQGRPRLAPLDNVQGNTASRPRPLKALWRH